MRATRRPRSPTVGPLAIEEPHDEPSGRQSFTMRRSGATVRCSSTGASCSEEGRCGIEGRWLTNRSATPWTMADGRCCSPIRADMTISEPVVAGMTHCSTASWRCAAATSGEVRSIGVVPSSAGVSSAAMMRCPMTRE